ncbi:M16 family metallopeptidase [Ktedonobacter robiniae]|uniref:Peptidase M16 n=1 Tax=Ktedonobacter robiniae TaxID=2778365 RepID=A0ABQ3UZ53_9CHLR|nr:pitrilysin family protein [Ktedonobacter robiniae]GHO57953.1 peptidase M16 [Ktedonobacter robiniae]
MNMFAADYLIKSIFPNGLQILVQPRRYARTTSWGIFVNHGVRDETKESNGISHFMEHVIFNAQYRSQSELARLVQQGAIVEAFTTKEYTQFSVTTVPAENDAALQSLATLIRRPSFNTSLIETERGVIDQEIKTFMSTRKSLDEWVERALFGNRSLGLFTLGPRENLDTFNEANLQERYSTYYTPLRTVIICQGAVEGTEVLEKVFDAFHDWAQKPTSIPPPRFEDVPQMIGIPTSSQQVSLYVAFRGPSLTNIDRLPFSLIADCLGLGVGSRLWNSLREERQLVYEIQATPTTYGVAGYMTIRLSCERNKVREVIQVLLAEIAKLHQGLDDSELERARTIRTTGLLHQHENSRLMLPSTGKFAVNGLTLFVDTEIQSLKLVTTDDTARVARQYLNEDTLAIVAYGLSREELLNSVA